VSKGRDYSGREKNQCHLTRLVFGPARAQIAKLPRRWPTNASVVVRTRDINLKPMPTIIPTVQAGVPGCRSNTQRAGPVGDGAIQRGVSQRPWLATFSEVRWNTHLTSSAG
jgi:hypothetical protein